MSKQEFKRIHDEFRDAETWRHYLADIRKIRNPEDNEWEAYLGEDVWWEWDGDERIVCDGAGDVACTSYSKDEDRMWGGKFHEVEINGASYQVEIVDGLNATNKLVTFANILLEDCVVVVQAFMWENDGDYLVPYDMQRVSMHTVPTSTS